MVNYDTIMLELKKLMRYLSNKEKFDELFKKDIEMWEREKWLKKIERILQKVRSGEVRA